jgi:hypothetical protein
MREELLTDLAANFRLQRETCGKGEFAEGFMAAMLIAERHVRELAQELADGRGEGVSYDRELIADMLSEKVYDDGYGLKSQGCYTVEAIKEQIDRLNASVVESPEPPTAAPDPFVSVERAVTTLPAGFAFADAVEHADTTDAGREGALDADTRRHIERSIRKLRRDYESPLADAVEALYKKSESQRVTPAGGEDVVFEPMWPAGLNQKEFYQLPCDDKGRNGGSWLKVMVAGDGDVHLMMQDWEDVPNGEPDPIPTLRCRNYFGGGRNERTHQALLWLARAIQLDTGAAERGAGSS